MRDKTRSGRDFHITCQLLKEGFTPEEITRIFISTPVGDKVREKWENDGEATALSYMTKTIENALKALAEEEYNRRSKIQSVIIIDNPRY
jgi:DNA topoisomerase IA